MLQPDYSKYDKLRSRSPERDFSIPTIASARDQHSPSSLAKLLSALFYAISSCFITIINKEVLTNYSFPAPFIVILGQIVSMEGGILSFSLALP